MLPKMLLKMLLDAVTVLVDAVCLDLKRTSGSVRATSRYQVDCIQHEGPSQDFNRHHGEVKGMLSLVPEIRLNQRDRVDLGL